MALIFAFGLVAAACGDSDDDSGDASTDTTAAPEDTTATTAAPATTGGAETTAAPDGTTDTTEGAAAPDGGTSLGDLASIEEVEAVWAAERQAIVDELTAGIESGEFGLGEDGIVRGPGGYEIDTNVCPGDWSNTAGLTDTEIRLGYTTAQSGNLAAYGDIALGMEAYFGTINDAGGVGGRNINLIVKDDGYVASQTIEAVDELLQNENVFSITTLGSPNTFAVRDTLATACMPQILSQTGHPAWGDPMNYPWTTGFQMDYYTEAALWVSWIEQNLADQAPVKVGALVMDNDFGLSYESGFNQFSEGSDVIGEFVVQKHDPAAPTVTNEVTTLAGEDLDVFISMTAGNPCLLAIQDAGRSGMLDTVTAAFTPSVCKGIEAYMGPAGEAADGWLIVGGGQKVSTDPQYADEAFIVWENEMLTAAGLDPNVDLITTGFSGFGWATGQALLIANELPEGLNRTNLMLALRSMDMSAPALLDGITFAVNGPEDPYFIEGSDISRFNATDQAWVIEGDVIDLNGEKGNCSWNLETSVCE
jgi:ABC-type branched-subunit amino acid transport system substrate-binding protein